MGRTVWPMLEKPKNAAAGGAISSPPERTCVTRYEAAQAIFQGEENEAKILS